jgi:uncharacterized protein (TIGR03118 family)
MRKTIWMVLTLLLVAIVAPFSRADADSYSQTDLSSDVPGLANTTDTNLVNPWGIAFSPTSPFWISNQGSGTASLLNGVGTPNALVVTIPGTTPPSGPTGQVFNSAGAGNFVLSDGTAASFLFDTLGGTIAGWNPDAGTTAQVGATTSGAIYTGLALGSVSVTNYLYAANFAGGINVFNSSFAPVTLAGSFTDPNLPAGYAPYNIQNIGGNLYVEYAEVGASGVVTGAGLGYVDEYSTSGNLIQRVVSGGQLNASWGVALAPATGFGEFSGDLLIANFGSGEIDAYDPTTDAFLGVLDGSNGLPLVNDDLWAIDFGNGGTDFNADTLYFTAGIDNEAEGLFGSIADTPEPATFALLLVGIFGLALFAVKRERLS